MLPTLPLIYTTTFLFLLGESLQPAPRISIYESIVCRQHYQHLHDGGGDTPKWDCKIPAVQSELALLTGMERLSIIIPSLLAIPFAALADRYGHALVLRIAIFGVLLEDLYPLVVCWFPDVFPIRLIWLHFFFSLIGGGMTVVVSLLHVIVAESVETEERTGVFFRLRAAGVGATVLGYAGSGWLMKGTAGAWVAWSVGLGGLFLSMVTTMGLANTTCVSEVRMEEEEENLKTGGNWRRWISEGVDFVNRVYALLGRNRQVLVVLVLVLLSQLGFDAVPLMLAIYVCKRFGWSFADASFLNSLEMLIELITLIAILPLATYLLSRYPLSPFSKDAHIARTSLFLLSAGCLLLGLSPSIGPAILGIVTIALGTGQDSVLRSMATDMVEPNGVSIVYSAITMVRAIGGSISGPIYAGLYSAGLEAGESWLGLPYLVAGMLCGIAALGVLGLRDVGGYERVGGGEEEVREE
ncbi:major facilitator superfamily domain-containing protein [Dendryphion nanum]|uniref:Major facilitator superfamily domain-containing protein n=1 Tax=Dendryphion nanum TaxID=256645 RepID=A0A9P9EEB1_9PLEO|nr:major facilitator superfamily domain-containing protein [Dendryphion nanum]